MTKPQKKRIILAQTGHGEAENDKIIETGMLTSSRVDALVIHVAPRAEGDQPWNPACENSLRFVFECVKKIWPEFKNQKSGRIVFSCGPSITTNFALLGLANTLNLEGAKYNIDVVLIMPAQDIVVSNKTISTCAVSLALNRVREPGHTAFQVHDKTGLTPLRWERAQGLIANPDRDFNADTVAAGWHQVQDFSNATTPHGPINTVEVLRRAQALLPNKVPSETIFDGKVVIVTGGAHGLGRAYCLAFARLGAAVVVNDVADPSGTVREILDGGGKATGVQASCEDGENIVRRAVDEFGRVDILINNAGILRDKSFSNMEAWQWDAVLKVHLGGTNALTQAAWPYLAKYGCGRIVNTTSTSGIYGHFGQANYSAAKLGIVGLTQETARRGADHGIRVNVVAPLSSESALMQASALANADFRHTPMKAEYNAPLVLLLCADRISVQANNVTGGVFEVGCGWQAAARLRPVTVPSPRAFL